MVLELDAEILPRSKGLESILDDASRAAPTVPDTDSDSATVASVESVAVSSPANDDDDATAMTSEVGECRTGSSIAESQGSIVHQHKPKQPCSPSNECCV
jgi:hypothetical protein